MVFVFCNSINKDCGLHKCDIENNKKMNGDELYLIFSMTKMITCTAALQLFEKGAITARQYISRLPKGMIPEARALLCELEGE